MRCSLKMIPVAVLVSMSTYLPPGAQTGAASVIQGESGAYWAEDAGRSTFLCSVSTLREQPDHLYPVSHIEQMVREAEVVARAVAVDTLPGLPLDSMAPYEAATGDPSEIVVGFPEIRFRTNEILRGPFPTTEFTFHGIVAEADDFNTLPVPYRMVRPSGQRGNCYARDYRLGSEYLFLLKRRDGALTPHWIALGPTNEQIRGDDDPWVKWVREQLAEDPGMEGRPPLPWSKTRC